MLHKNKIIFAMLFSALFIISGCSTSLQGRTLQIAGQEGTDVWEKTDLQCQVTQNCIDKSLEAGAKLEEIQGDIRCDTEAKVCEVKIRREFISNEN